MPSPWQAVNYWFFILFVISTGLLILFIWKNKNYQTSILAVSLHLFVMYGIAGILYSLGYGFDAFIHRATEQWILVNGSILPKTPYYIGQYSLVAWMAHLTNLPIFYIDVYLVPILASVSLPLVISTTLKKIWYIPYKIGILLTLFIPFIPFLSFNLTTPHNLVILFTVLIVFTTLGYLKDKITLIIPILLSLASLAIHPLVATPTLIFLVGIIITKKITSSKLSLIFHLLFFTAITLTVPILFLINNFLNNAPLPQFTNSLTQFPLFLELFRCPYWYLTHAPLLYEIIYAWQWLIIPTALTLCVGGFLMIKKKIPAIYLFPLTTIALFLSAWFLRSWIVFPDVVSYEQGDYPMRLLKTSLIFILPFGMYMIHRALKHLNTLAQKQFNHLTIKQLSTQKTAFTFMLVTIISTVIMLSLYFSYPQRNIKSRFPGFNVTASDFEAVEWIYKQETDFSFSPALDMNQSTMTEGVILGLMDGTNLIEKKPHEFDYIVLSNQLVSAAALTKYSFAKYFQTNHGEIFYYAIPTGGDLYRQYGKMLYEGQKRAYMNDAMEIAGVNKAYFVINNYWANANKIIEGAKMSADSWEVIGDGDVWIFVYKK
ncbi:MAG: hypothetical protein COX81_01505 [Candidatus Magasanikbacteria bacterium CG_4_10_14_0_2_um_filter_37_12]|uniref:Uncharacterized protein n=1 Tax=Candidatus Magasanikbacteria bacterium CG_4_10_14_0_2_um_filter_37_12 TaxID=1974637 RepID=A0A2M7V8X7_9BACT|nr:MAG: hypothetical protein COX81_01505 [Candidatus Magasanikbacteria bacterium CG_4_10_14_0_2_um_filter_37_12]